MSDDATGDGERTPSADGGATASTDEGPGGSDAAVGPTPEDLDEKEFLVPSTADSRVKQWFLLRGNRLAVSAAIVGGVFFALVGANQLWPFELLDLVTETDTLGTILNTLLSGTILLVSVVVSINSVVLSQDLTSVGTQRDRLQNAVAFRESVEELAEMDASPTDPSEFIRTTLEVVLERTTQLEATLGEGDLDDEAARQVRRVVENVELNTRIVVHRVMGADPDSVDVLVAGLDYSYSNEIQAIQLLNAEYGDDMTPEQRECIEAIVEALEQYAIANEYFKSLFYMREFAKLSKTLLYVALPVIVITAYVMLAINAGQIPQFTVARLSGITLFTMAAFSVALAPYVVFTAFVLRSATIAARTLAVGPFSMHER